MSSQTKNVTKTRVMPLRLRGTAGHFTFDDNSIWAWYTLTPQRWSFLTDSERAGTLSAQATGYGELIGRPMKLRVTHQPYPAHEWARRLDSDSPKRLDLDSFDALLRDTQRVMHHLSTAEARHYVGFEVGPRGGIDKIVDGFLPHQAYDWVVRRAGLDDRMLRRLSTDIDQVDQVVTERLDGRRATPAEIDFLIDRSRALGIPPAAGHPNPEAPAGEGDLYPYTDGIEVIEKPFERHLSVIDRRGDHDVTSYVTVLTLGRVERLPWPPPHLPLLAIPTALGFPVEICVTGKLMSGLDAQRSMNRQLIRVSSQLKDYQDQGLTPPPALELREHHARQIGGELEEPIPAVSSRWRGWIRFAVAGSTEAEVARRTQRLMQLYREHHIPIHREPQTRELLNEFMPHERVGSAAYVRQMPVRMFASALPQVTSAVGDRSGPLMGSTVSGPRRPVLMHPQFGPEQLEGPGLCPVISGLGGGKSFLLGLAVEQNVLRGIGATVLDPSAGAFPRLAAMPHLRQHARVIDLVNGRPGSLSPWAVVAEPRRDHYDTDDDWRTAVKVAAQERMVLAEDICRSLLPAELAGHRDLRLALTDAISDVGGDPDRNLYQVVQALGTKGDLAASASRFLMKMADYPRASLFFDTGATREIVDETLLVVTFSGLVIPQAGTDRSTWTTEEQISVPLLNLATALTFRRVARKPRTERHMVVFDELGILQEFPSFRAAFTRFSRDSRKLNTQVLKADQTPNGVINMGLLPFVGSAWVGVTDDDQAAMDALQILGLKPDARYAQVLRGLPRSKPERPLSYRDFVYRDPAGRVERVRVSADHRPGLITALDTTPRQQRAAADDVQIPELHVPDLHAADVPVSAP